MRIATLCGMGFGTSMMLKLFIEDILKAEGIKAQVIPWDLGSFKGQQADIVVAPQPGDPSGAITRVLVVSVGGEPRRDPPGSDDPEEGYESERLSVYDVSALIADPDEPPFVG